MTAGETFRNTALRRSRRPSRGSGGARRRRFFVIANPGAGGGGEGRLSSAMDHLRARGAEVEPHVTASHGEGARLAREAAGSGLFDAVLAAGGDGTVHDAAQGLVGTSCPLGVIPLGTANVLAREIGMSLSPQAVADTLLHGPARAVPTGVANGEIFLFVVGVGFDAAAVRHFEAGGHRRLGLGGLLPPVLRALAESEDRPLRVELDGAAHAAHWVIVTRVPHYAANILLCERASLFSEDLCAVLFRGGGPGRRLRQLAAMLTGMLRYEPSVSILRARRVRIEGPPATPVQMDGESTGRLPLALSVGDGRLRLIFPPDAPDAAVPGDIAGR